MPRPNHPMKPREIDRLLCADGWSVKRKGPGDHVQYAHPTKPGKVTLDMGADPIPTGTLWSIFRQAGGRGDAPDPRDERRKRCPSLTP